jgi:putative membrane protein
VSRPGGGTPGTVTTESRDPDARFLLANERTLLAWLRTGLALQGGGVVVFQLASNLGAREMLGLALVVVGAVCHVVGWWRYRSADRAIRENRLPTRGLAPDLVVLVLVVTSVAVTVALVA